MNSIYQVLANLLKISHTQQVQVLVLVLAVLHGLKILAIVDNE